jgi:Zn-dependent protease with chaperone function
MTARKGRPPPLAELATRGRRDRILGLMLLWLLMLGAALILLQPWNILSGSTNTAIRWMIRHKILTVYFLALTLWQAIIRYRPLYLYNRRITPLRKTAPELLGDYTAEDIEAIVTEVRRDLKRPKGEVPSVYIVPSPEANAMSLNSYFLNRARRLNAVYLFSFVLRTFNREELKALMGHELGHFYLYQNPLSRAPFFLRAAITVLMLAGVELLAGDGGILWSSGWPFTFLGFCFVLTPLHFFLTSLVYRPFQRFDPYHEFLADAAGAATAGPMAIINSLLKLGTRMEVVFRAIEEALRIARQHKNIPIPELMHQVIQRLPHQHVSLAEAKRIVRREVARISETKGKGKAEKKAISDKQRQRQLKELKEVFGTSQSWRIVDWREFDTHIRDNRLDETEIGLFVAKLKEDPDLMAFGLACELASGPAERGTPTLRDRIIFIYDNFLAAKQRV